nr:hypothetical protein CFP56_11206 [Quercus suber]
MIQRPCTGVATPTCRPHGAIDDCRHARNRPADSLMATGAGKHVLTGSYLSSLTASRSPFINFPEVDQRGRPTGNPGDTCTHCFDTDPDMRTCDCQSRAPRRARTARSDEVKG